MYVGIGDLEWGFSVNWLRVDGRARMSYSWMFVKTAVENGRRDGVKGSEEKHSSKVISTKFSRL